MADTCGSPWFVAVDGDSSSRSLEVDDNSTSALDASGVKDCESFSTSSFEI